MSSFLYPSSNIYIHLFFGLHVICYTLHKYKHLQTFTSQALSCVFYKYSHSVFQIFPVCIKLSINRNCLSLFLCQNLLTKFSFCADRIRLEHSLDQDTATCSCRTAKIRTPKPVRATYQCQSVIVFLFQRKFILC